MVDNMGMATAEERALWAIIKPYVVNCKLVDNAPPEVVAAENELKRLAWICPAQ